MNKKVLAIYYSQSGQLGQMIDNFCEPLEAAGATVEKVRVTLQNDFPFPWTTKKFFSVMPDCVLGVQTAVNPIQLRAESYDLVVIGYQAWFLSPSIPFNSFMHEPAVLNAIRNTPVITITGARNMWITAFERAKKLLRAAGANHVGTIALTDRHLNLVSIFTIFHWLVGGKKTKYLGFFPLPGVSDADILNTKNFGAAVIPFLENNQWSGLKEKLVAMKAVALKFHLLFMESKASMMFGIWARVIVKSKKRNILLTAFKYYLLIALFIFAPIVFMVDLLVFKPFLSKYVKSKKEAVLQLN